jgi:hypothetical protein
MLAGSWTGRSCRLERREWFGERKKRRRRNKTQLPRKKQNKRLGLTVVHDSQGVSEKSAFKEGMVTRPTM